MGASADTPTPAQRAARNAEARLRKRLAEVRAEFLGLAERGVALSLGGAWESARGGRLRRPGAGRASGAAAAWAYRDPWSLGAMRADCQWAERNDPVVGALIDSMIDLDLMDGSVPKAATAAPEWNKRADEAFAAWFGDPKRCDLAGLLNGDAFAAAAERAWMVDGDMAVLLVDEGEGRLQAIEADRIRNPGAKTDSARLKGGFETDAQGRPLRVHIAEWDDQGYAWIPETRAYDAAAVLHLRNPMDAAAGVVRPAPMLQSVLKRLEEIKSYDEAVRTAAWVHACLAAFIAVENPALHAEAAFDAAEEPAAGASGNRVVEQTETLAPGMIRYLQPNERPYFSTPGQPGATYEAFVRLQLGVIGARLGLPYCVAFLDGTGLNLSTIRCVMQLAWRRALRRQEALRVHYYVPVRRWWTARAIARGELPYVPDWDQCEVILPPAPVMDPKTEIDAARSAIDGGLSDRGYYTMQIFGRDAEQIDRLRAEEKRREKELGVEPVGMPGQKPAGGGDGRDGGDRRDDGPPDDGDRSGGRRGG